MVETGGIGGVALRCVGQGGLQTLLMQRCQACSSRIRNVLGRDTWAEAGERPIGVEPQG